MGIETTYKLKIKPEFYHDIFMGDKSFEIRVNDRGYQKGDTIQFINPDNVNIPYDDEVYEITYVLNHYGLKEGWVVFGIRQT